MAAPTLAPILDSASRRRFLRYPIKVSLEVIALQSGIPNTMPGRCTDLSETGLGAIVAGELLPGQAVAIELRLPNVGLPVQARAQVRYQDRLRCGLQFVGLSLEQREKIRYWSAAIAPIPSQVGPSKVETSPVSLRVVAPLSNNVAGQERLKRRIGVNRRRFYALAALLAMLAGFGWWRWQNAWNELEMDSTAATDVQNGLPLRVSPDTMDRQIVYKVDPVYPDAARQAGTQGLVVLDAVIAQDGTVRRLHPVAGPRVLAQSAVDAVRSWKYTPYRSGGQAVEVATTVSVDFRLR